MQIDNHAFDRYSEPETLKSIVDFSCMSSMWNHSVESYGRSSALVDGKNYTFKDLDSEVACFRTVLKEAGISTGDRVGIFVPNSGDFVKAFLAVTTFGACAVLLPPHLNEMAVFGCSIKFGLKALIYDKSLEEGLIVLKTKNPGFVLIESAASSETETASVEVDSDAPCAVLFTGGTTGKSKGALLSHRAVLRGVKNGCYGYKDVFGQRYMQLLPLTHVFGLIRTMLTSVYTGSSLWICRNNKDMFRDIAVHKPTILILVPALAEMALNLSRQFGKNMLGPDMKTIIAGAAVVAPYLAREYQKYGITLLPGYGLTESANLVSGNPEPIKKASSVGLVYPDMEVKVVDGELWLKGPNMLDCYVGEDEENRLAFEDGWFKTGDLVSFDDDGFLFITGRKKEVIVLSTGENISPAELETKFNEIDCIQDSLVYVSTENGKETLAVQIYPRAAVLKMLGVEDVDAFIRKEINEVNNKLPAFERVGKIIIRENDFVRSPSMKILRGKNDEK